MHICHEAIKTYGNARARDTIFLIYYFHIYPSLLLIRRSGFLIKKYNAPGRIRLPQLYENTPTFILDQEERNFKQPPFLLQFSSVLLFIVEYARGHLLF